MSGEICLNRRAPARPLISLVPMIDVMLILLVFFMVTSTYLNLDMIPALSRSDSPVAATPTQTDQPASTLLLRIGGDGVAHIRGQALSLEALGSFMRDQMAARPGTQVIILPTGAAQMQALVSVLDTLTRSGVTNMRVMRLEAQP